VAKIADETELLRETMGDVSAALADVLRAIEAVPDEMQKTVLTLRYVEGLDWLAIAEHIHYERTQTLVLHGRALWSVRQWMEGKDR
jgi:DNA-directed RNA polymerase specialized sigma24 family protein